MSVRLLPPDKSTCFLPAMERSPRRRGRRNVTQSRPKLLSANTSDLLRIRRAIVCFVATTIIAPKKATTVKRTVAAHPPRLLPADSAERQSGGSYHRGERELRAAV